MSLLASAVQSLETSSNKRGSSDLNYASLVYRSETGAALDFGNVPWLAEIYSDDCPDQTHQKASQVGMTTRALMRTVALAKLGYPGLYVLPDDAFRSDFMRERFNPIVQHNPDWRTNIGSAYKNADAMSVKHLWGIPWKFVGARNKKNFFSFTAAAAIVDEYDLCNQSNLGFLEDRFGRQDKVFFYRFGNPGLPARGSTPKSSGPTASSG